MAFPRNLLNQDEELVLDLRPHWIFLVKAVALFVLAIVLAILGILVWGPDGNLGSIVNIVAAVLVLVTLAYLGWTYVVWNTTNFVLTSDRIVSRRGVLSKEGVEIPLERVNTVFFRQSVLERILGSGDLAIESAGEKGSESFTDIRKPSIVQKEIYVQMEANENRKFDRIRGHLAPGGGIVPPAAPPVAQPATPGDAQPLAADAPTAVSQTIPEQIEKLSELHQRGVLSDAEFQQKKAELLGRM